MNTRVWWIPQVPMQPFFVEVADLSTAVDLMDVLADYDLFQFENKIKPDYCNTGGIQIRQDGEWVDLDDDEYPANTDPSLMATVKP